MAGDETTARRQGMADVGRDEVGPMVLGAWDAFLQQAAAVDLDRPTRLPGWRVHEVCVHLGCWDDHAALLDLVASARAGGAGTPPDVDATNARVTAAHRDASREEVLAALRRNRDATAHYLADEPVELDTAPAVAVVGRLPLLSVVLGQAYELAVHGLDLVPCGAPPPPRAVLQAGLAALADVTGALAAREGVTGGATLATPDGGWVFAADEAGWTVRRTPAGNVTGTAVEAPADLLLEAASGRVNPVVALARRRLRVHELGGLLALAPIVQAAPGIPGGPILQLAAQTLGGVGGLLGRLRGRR
ncbi:maleylpyruvate isomerase family mycothiol-dependent enzyme [Geodermatophilus sp. DF01-2]|uniref:maleylpyruvate isomerase N-terminal domain-containing protein n=1 Tax=Geodermatophilus sp. DF01-2 TaxID=2559610 RepID=UPI00107476B1|nr:maleylpyruvate isomerase N-terminal domain-containing protein [Geodermatophilus sp. DF01_2]TFV54549.1 maleylpyruvate isomerase family mycothiol-dependent enzyme [Geodermatophilus sp. DF01_2]